MKSKILIVLVVLAFVGGGYYFVSGRSSFSTLTEIVSKPGGSKSDLFTGTLKAAVEMGIPLKCEYEVSGNKFEGVIKGENFIGKIRMQDGKSGNMLMKNNCMYTWEENSSQGISWCFNDADMSVWEQTGDNMPAEYKCRPTVVTNSAFNVPSGVQFMSIDDMME